MFPRIDSPCPIEFTQLPTSGNFHCSACSREVHDLTHLSEAQRRSFLANCTGSVCVSYKLKSLRIAALAGALVVATNGFAMPAAAGSQENSLSASMGSQLEEDVIDAGARGGIDTPKSRAAEKDAPEEEILEKSPNLIPIVEE